MLLFVMRWDEETGALVMWRQSQVERRWEETAIPKWSSDLHVYAVEYASLPTTIKTS